MHSSTDYHWAFKHGHAKTGCETPEYRAWHSMWNRCTNSRVRSFKSYGGRGIAVCPDWRDFAAFFSDVGQRPSPAHSLDRVNVNGNYEPGNVRWATAVEQIRNRRDARRFEVDGASVTLMEASEQYGILYTTLAKRWRSGKRQACELLAAVDLRKSNRTGDSVGL